MKEVGVLAERRDSPGKADVPERSRAAAGPQAFQSPPPQKRGFTETGRQFPVKAARFRFARRLWPNGDFHLRFADWHFASTKPLVFEASILIDGREGFESEGSEAPRLRTEFEVAIMRGQGGRPSLRDAPGGGPDPVYRISGPGYLIKGREINNPGAEIPYTGSWESSARRAAGSSPSPSSAPRAPP